MEPLFEILQEDFLVLQSFQTRVRLRPEIVDWAKCTAEALFSSACGFPCRIDEARWDGVGDLAEAAGSEHVFVCNWWGGRGRLWHLCNGNFLPAISSAESSHFSSQETPT